MHLPPHIAARVRTAVESLDDQTLPGRVGREFGALPLFADIGGAILLRPDGALLELEWDQPSEQAPREVTDPQANIGLVVGAENYPWLAELLPPRPLSAQPCSQCGGRGRIAIAGQSAVYCGVCGARGWIAG